MCGIDNNVTIHETQENEEGNEEMKEEQNNLQNDLVIANAKTKTGLGQTNPLDKAVEEDDLYWICLKRTD